MHAPGGRRQESGTAVGKSAAALLLESAIGREFDAIVTGATGRGTWVRLSLPPVEGRLDGDATGLQVGDRLRVKLIRTDVERGFIDCSRSSRSRPIG
ncbi:MAG TPA: hypothetical protein VIO38_16735 [Rariglobus sp.]